MSWNYAYTPYIWPLLGAVLLLLALSALSWRRRRVPGALPFSIGALLAAVWLAGSVMEYSAVDMSIKIGWVKFQAALQLFTVTAITCFFLDFVWPGRWLTRRNLALLSILPLLTLGLIATNDAHHLVWSGFAFDGKVIPLREPLIEIIMALTMGLSMINLIASVWLMIRSPQHRWPIVIMMTGEITLRVVYLIDWNNMVHTVSALSELGVGFAFGMYAIALFGFRIFDPIPMAHQVAIQQLHAGILVLDSQGNVASLNHSAEKILYPGQANGHPWRGRPVRELLPLIPETALTNEDETELEIRLGQDGNARFYALSITHLKDFRGFTVGSLLMLRDVSGQKRAQVQILEQQRALAMLQEREQLARELHDNLGQVFAFINAQGQAAGRQLSHGNVTAAGEIIGRLVEAAREADTDIRESISGLRESLSEGGFFAALAKYLCQYERNCAIRVALEKPEGISDAVFEPIVAVQLLRILQEALTNVRKHANAQRVHIRFALENDGGPRQWACVTVRDDGCGFDASALSDKSGGHFGLRVMQERVEAVGGQFTLHAQPGRGTTVVIRVPVRLAGDTEPQMRKIEHG